MEYIYFKSENRRRAAVRYTCETCKIVWLVDKRYQPKNSSYICKECKKKEGNIVTNCAHCGKEITKNKSKVRSKFSFCNRKCKEAEQTHNGLLALPHYDSDISYRTKALVFYGLKCKDCDITEKYLLAVHHIDGNRENNELNNLEVVCHNHHAERHKQFVNGEWVLKFNVIK